MLIGSEGILGVIAEAWVRVRPRPQFKASASVAFDDFGAAAEAALALAQSGLHPANCRLLDAAEAELTGAGDGSANLLILGFESADIPVDKWMDLALDIARDHGGEPGEVRKSGNGDDAVSQWRGAFLLAPYLRDTFVACGVLSETFETAITWDRFEEFHATVMETARRAVSEVSGVPADGPGPPESAAASPTSIPTVSPPTSPSSPRRSVAGRSSNGTRSRPPSPTP